MEEQKLRKVIVYGDHFWKFYWKQSIKVRERIDWSIKLVQTVPRVPEKYFRNLKGTSLYEIRTSSGSNIYRVFCFFDRGQLVILLNAFQKKSQKTPKTELELAKKLQKQYFNEKNENSRL